VIVLLICLIFSKYCDELLEYEVGARATGVGNAYTALCSDPSAFYWNPAALTSLKKSQILIEYSAPFSNFYKIYSFSLNLKNSAIFGINYLIFDSILQTDTLGNILSIFSVKDYVFNITTGKKLHDFSAGVNLKLIYRDYFEANCYGMGIDFGLFKRISELRFGLCIRNIFGTHLLWSNGNYEIASPSLNLGLAFSHKLKDGILSFTSDFSFYTLKRHTEFGTLNLDTRFGIEYLHENLLFIRAGKDKDKLTCGIGIKLPDLYLDGAIELGEHLGVSKKVSGGVVWR